jgi:methyltransferase (TIGR00027 family)
VSRINGAILVALVAAALAVEPGKPSKTSIAVTALRAIGAKNPDAALRNPDYLAIKFLGRAERAVLAAEWPVDILDVDFAEAIRRVPVPALVAVNVSRTKYVDSAFIEALGGGAKQIVILGAGFDTRGIRFRNRLRGVRFFEVDYGPTQEYKKRRTKEVFGSLPQHIRYVSIDFTTEDLLSKLRAAGYSETDKTFFVWEGVLMYIPESAVRDTLRFVRDHSATGSTIIFNYPLAAHPDINNPNSGPAKSGEMWVFGFPGESATPFVRNAGLEVVSDVSAIDLIRKFGVRADGTSNLPFQPPPPNRDIRYCIARVP